MKPSPTLHSLLLAGSLLAAHTASAAVITWSGGGTDNNWSTSANWSDGLPAGNDVVFAATDATGTTGPLGTPNNIVDADTTITSLKFTNIEPGNHTTEIPTGVTLTVDGGIEVQSPTTDTNDVVYATILGDGKLTANNTTATLYVGQGSANASTTRRATLDMSGLEEFSATLNQIVVGRQLTGGPNRPQGTLRLAHTNTLTLSANPGILLGNVIGNNGNQVLELGVSNTIRSDNGITIGGRKGSGTLRFNSDLVGPGEGTATFRNLAGTGRQNNWLIGDNFSQNGGSNSASGSVDFSVYGEVDALVNSIILGRSNGTQSAGNNIFSAGTLSFDRGTINTNSLTAGIQPNTATVPNSARGTVNVHGTGKLLVNGDLTLGRDIGQETYNAQGFLNIGTGIGGGEIEIRGNLICGLNSIGNKITVHNGGTLRLGGTLGLPGINDDVLETLDLEDSTLVFNFGATPNPIEGRANVGTLTTAGTVDIKVTGGNLTPGTIKLIDYASLDGGGFTAFNLLPTIGITASLVDNAVDGSVDLVITEVSSLTWAGTPNGDWDIAGTANWLTVPGNTASTYDEIDGLGFATTFDDTATGTKTVNLTTVLSPQSVLVDTAGTYTFTGTGSISGGSALVKQGEGTLVLDAGTTHTGATTISEGTLQIGAGGTTGSLSLSSAITNNATLAFNRSDTLTQGTDFAAVLGGSGGLTQAGSGTLVLTGANNYTGATTVSQGILQVGIGGTAGTLGANSNTSIASGAELHIDRSTDNFGYSYTGELSGEGTVNVLPSRRFNFQTNNQIASGSLSFIVDGTLAINSGSGVTSVHFGDLSGSGVIQRAGVAPANPQPVVLTIGGKNTSSTYSGVITGIAEFAVDKVGSGTLTLAGTTYGHGGTTTVSSGTLALGEAATIANSSAFNIAAGAVLDTASKASFPMAGSQAFTFGVDPAGSGTTGVLAAQELDITTAVVSLAITGTLDDPAYVLATYTSLAGTAFATEPVIPAGYQLQYNYQGNKIALVAGTSSGFASWQTVNGATGGLGGDHDNDGVSDGIEYFLGGPNGNTTGFTALPGVTNTGGTLSITWTKGPGYSGTYGTDFLVETSATLANPWTTETEGVNVTITGDNVTYTFPNPLGTRNFARLKVTGP